MQKQTKPAELDLLRIKCKHTINICLFCTAIAIAIIGPIVFMSTSTDEAYSWLQWLCLGVLLIVPPAYFVVTGLKYNSIILSILNAKLITDKDMPELIHNVECLSDKLNAPKPFIYLTKKECVTVISAGWWPKKSIVILSSKAIDTLKAEELQCLIAHEICHIQNHDHLARGVLFIITAMWLALVGSIIWFPIDTLNEARKVRSPRTKRPVYTVRQRFIVSGLVLGFVFIPYLWGVRILIAKLTAEYEYRADIGSLRMTGNPAILAGAIAKLALAYKDPIDYPFQLFMLFDIVEPFYPRKILRRIHGFYRAPIKLEIAKRMAKLDDLDGLSGSSSSDITTS